MIDIKLVDDRYILTLPKVTLVLTKVEFIAARAEGIALADPRHHVTLAVDATGVGRAVLDLLKREPMPHVTLVPILITGGDVETHDKGVWHVPKRNLVGVVQIALQTQRLKIAAQLPESTALIHELQHFQMKIALTTGDDSYGAWREGTHDDLVLALACALWAGERSRRWTWEPVRGTTAPHEPRRAVLPTSWAFDRSQATPVITER